MYNMLLRKGKLVDQDQLNVLKKLGLTNLQVY